MAPAARSPASLVCCVKERPDTKIILSEPANAQLVGCGIAQKRGAENAPAVSHSAFQPHPIQGWTPDFIPYVLQEAIDENYFDELIPVPGPVGNRMVKQAGPEGGHLHRDFRRRQLCGRHAGR